MKNSFRKQSNIYKSKRIKHSFLNINEQRKKAFNFSVNVLQRNETLVELDKEPLKLAKDADC